jgi:hypothetical protein
MCPAHNEVFRVTQNILSICRPPALPFCQGYYGGNLKKNGFKPHEQQPLNGIAPRAGSKHDRTIIRFGFFATGCKTAIANSKIVGSKK